MDFLLSAYLIHLEKEKCSDKIYLSIFSFFFYFPRHQNFIIIILIYEIFSKTFSGKKMELLLSAYLIDLEKCSEKNIFIQV